MLKNTKKFGLIIICIIIMIIGFILWKFVADRVNQGEDLLSFLGSIIGVLILFVIFSIENITNKINKHRQALEKNIFIRNAI